MAKCPTIFSLDLVYLLMCFTFFILLITSYKLVHDSNHKYIHLIGMNWRNGPISSIYQSCSGNEFQNLVSNEWPGIDEGCYCPEANVGLKRGQCQLNKSQGCYDIPSIDPSPYISWKGRGLCGERFNSTYFDLTIVSDIKKCPPKTRSCGIIDSLNNYLCVQNGLDCPLMKNDKIINELMISNARPCADPIYNNYSNNSRAYILDPYYKNDRCFKKVGNYTYDGRYFKLDSYNNFKLLSENLIYPKVYNLPLRNDRVFQEVGIYGRGYIGISEECRANLIDKESIFFSINSGKITNHNADKFGNQLPVGNKIIDELHSLKDKIDECLTLIIICILMVFIILLSIIIYLLVTFSCEDGQIPSDYFLLRRMGNMKTRGIILFLPMMLSLGVSVLSAVASSRISFYSEFNEYLPPHCVDTITNAAIGKFTNNVGNAKMLLKFSGCFGILIFIVPFVPLLAIFNFQF